MDQDILHATAVEVAKRILAGTEAKRYELGVEEGGEDARVFDDLVELAKQVLRKKEVTRTRQAAP
jgi:hypothetical protein